MKNIIIEIPDSHLCVMLANGSGYKDVPIVLTKENYAFLSQTVDTTFYIQISKGTVYAKTAKCFNGRTTIYRMHRLLTRCPIDMVVDHHPNHYGLDNRFCEQIAENNLTIVPPSENILNKKQYHTTNEFLFPFFPKLTNPNDLSELKNDIEKIKRLNLV